MSGKFSKEILEILEKEGLPIPNKVKEELTDRQFKNSSVYNKMISVLCDFVDEDYKCRPLVQALSKYNKIFQSALLNDTCISLQNIAKVLDLLKELKGVDTTNNDIVLFICSETWNKLILDRDFAEVYDPVTKYELLASGKAGMVLGLEIYSDLCLPENERLLAGTTLRYRQKDCDNNNKEPNETVQSEQKQEDKPV